MVNVIVLKGRLTKDPESFKSANGNNVVNFDLAVDKISKEADGTRGTSFFTCKCFNKVAENVEKSLHKASAIVVTGAIEQRTFMRKDGTKGSTYEIICDSVEFLDPAPKQEAEIPYDEVDAVVQGAEVQAEVQTPRFDPMTGKPLTKTAVKK